MFEQLTDQCPHGNQAPTCGLIQYVDTQMIIAQQFEGTPPDDAAETADQVKQYLEEMIPALDEASQKLHLIATGEKSTWSPDGKNSTGSDRRKRAVAPLACAELAELVAKLGTMLKDGVDKYSKSFSYNWPASTILRICEFIEKSDIQKEDCSDPDIAVINDEVKAYQVELSHEHSQ